MYRWNSFALSERKLITPNKSNYKPATLAFAQLIRKVGFWNSVHFSKRLTVKSKALLFLVLLLLGVPALAQEFGSASGIVSNGDNPVAGATITFTPRHNVGQVRQTQTDRNGRYSLVQLLATFYNARASFENRQMVVENVQVAANHNSEVNFRFQGEEAHGGVAGTVSDPDGNPIAAAEVVLTRGDHHLATRTNDHGQYAFENLAVGDYTGRASKNGYVAAETRFAVQANEVTQVDFVLEPAQQDEVGGVAGVVTNPDGAPLGAVEVAISRNDNNGEAFRQATRTNDHGQYAFENVPVGEFTLTAARQGYQAYSGRVAVQADEVTEANIVLRPAENHNQVGAVIGSVSDSNGNMLGGSEVVLTGANNNNRYATHTNERGQYSLANVVIGVYAGRAFKAGFNPQEIRIEVQANAVTEANFVLEPAQQDEVGGVAGTVTNTDGAALARVEVVISRDGNDGNGFRVATQTNDHGQYAFEEVPVGDFAQRAVKEGYQAYQGHVGVRAGQVTQSDIVLHPAEQNHEAGGVSGAVSDPDGNPIVAAVVVIEGANNRLATHTNDHGQYSFANVPVGDYHGQASKDGYNAAGARFAVQQNQVTHVDYVLEPQEHNEGDDVGRIVGHVNDPDGAPIRGAEVLVILEGGDPNGGDRHAFRYMTRTGEHGGFEVPDAPVGVLELTVSKLNFETYHGQVEVVADQATNVDIVLQPENHENDVVGSFIGTVTDEAGAAIEFALVTLVGVDDNRDPHNGHHYSAQTDAHGAFAIENVLVGGYASRASKLGYQADEQQVEIVEGRATQADFVLVAEEGRGGGGDPDNGGDTLATHGIAIVIAGDVADIYLLDIDADGGADYILYFGPPDYDPGNGAARPNDGDEIEIVGLMVGNMQPPLVIILEINGQVWREQEDGHGGRPGGGNGWEGAVDLEMVQVEGSIAIPEPRSPWYHRYFLHSNDDQHPDYRLLFGEDEYDPGNGAARPEADDFVNVVGGMFQPRDGLPAIVVYEINGEFWRNPADTMNLFWELPESVEESPHLPLMTALIQSYPNPYNPGATISVTLPKTMRARVSVIDLTGREVALIADRVMPLGKTLLRIEGNSLNAGTYFLRLETPSGGMVERITLLK